MAKSGGIGKVLKKNPAILIVGIVVLLVVAYILAQRNKAPGGTGTDTTGTATNPNSTTNPVGGYLLFQEETSGATNVTVTTPTSTATHDDWRHKQDRPSTPPAPVSKPPKDADWRQDQKNKQPQPINKDTDWKQDQKNKQQGKNPNIGNHQNQEHKASTIPALHSTAPHSGQSSRTTHIKTPVRTSSPKQIIKGVTSGIASGAKKR